MSSIILRVKIMLIKKKIHIKCIYCICIFNFRKLGPNFYKSLIALNTLKDNRNERNYAANVLFGIQKYVYIYNI